MDCSIIICTRNRASMLEKTLRAFQSVKVPVGWRVEMIVADNGSADHTAEVVKSAGHASIEIRHVYEPRPGKSRAQNAAMAHARGEALLFTDDDVEPADNWVENMARPLLENRCEAVAGRILLAEDLRRPWFTHLHEMWLAEVREPAADSPELVGASMGIHRSVFETIGNFDEELGPGATGFGEETLVWMQMMEAGLRICPVNDTFVIHRPDPSRLLRSAWLTAAARYGRTNAYLMHHWQHARVPYPALRVFLLRMKLFLRSLPRQSARLDAEGCPDWEMSYLTRIEGLKRFIEESGRPRNYGPRALRGSPVLTKP
jgi:glycosyltransferase involved in cell wall biosynthesis